MNDNYTLLASFEYSTEAQLIKSKLDSEEIITMLMDEVTVDSDPLISSAIGGVKLLILNKDAERALEIYNGIRLYNKDKNGNDIHCVKCNSIRILIAPLKNSNFFHMLFPFFEKKKYICNDCKTIFK